MVEGGTSRSRMEYTEGWGKCSDDGYRFAIYLGRNLADSRHTTRSPRVPQPSPATSGGEWLQVGHSETIFAGVMVRGDALV